MENHNYVDVWSDNEESSDILLRLLNRIQKIDYYTDAAYNLLSPTEDAYLPTKEEVDNAMAILNMGNETISDVINDLYKVRDLIDRPEPTRKTPKLPDIKFVPKESPSPVHPRPVDLNAIVGKAKNSNQYNTKEALAQIRACMDPTSYSDSKDQLYYIKSVLDQTKDLDHVNNPKDES